MRVQARTLVPRWEPVYIAAHRKFLLWKEFRKFVWRTRGVGVSRGLDMQRSGGGVTDVLHEEGGLSLWDLTHFSGKRPPPCCHEGTVDAQDVGGHVYGSLMDSLPLILLLVLITALATGGIVFILARRSGPTTDAAAAQQLTMALAKQQALEGQLRIVTENANVRIQEYQQRLTDAQAELQSQRQGFELRLAQMTDVRDRELHAKARQMQEDEAEQGQILAALAPVAENLQTLQKRLNTLEEQRQQQFGTLSEQLSASQETERQLHHVTQSLESALRNTTVRGSWGETQLRNIVEASGLVDQVDFMTQVTIEHGEERLRPDMIIRMPGGKALPVDSKVPFDAFIRANEIPASGTVEQQALREQLLGQHVKALKAHIDALAKKDYGRWVDGSPDFTIAFIPSESLLSAALETDPTLLDYSFRRRVALASPVTLWSVLKTVSFAWQQDRLTQEAQEVFQLARELYERLSTLGGHTKALGKDLTKAVDSYNRFIGSLERRVLVSARKLQAIDEETLIETLSPLEVSPRTLTDPALIGAEE